MKIIKHLSTCSLFLSIVLSGGVQSTFAAEEKPGKDPMTEMLKPLTGTPFEAAFIDQMIQHHRGATDMAGLVSSHTKRPELIKLGATITSTQELEIGELTLWLKKWANAEPAKMPAMAGHEKMMAGMAKLQAAQGPEFDRMFLEMMMEHHAGAIRMSELVKEKTIRPELLAFAAKVIKDQTVEIEQMKTWQTEWFKK